MKYCFEMRARAQKDQSIEKKHTKLVKALISLPAPWGLPAAVPPVPDPGTQLMASSNLGKYLDKRFKGHIYYQFRRDFRDEAGHDDFVDITFQTERIDYRTLVLEIVPRYVEAFDAYLAMVKGDEFSDLDYEELRKIRFDHRSMVYRIFPVCFFDSLLCERAFKLTPEQVVNRLKEKVEHTQLLSNGVYIVVKSTPLDFNDANTISQELRGLLR